MPRILISPKKGKMKKFKKEFTMKDGSKITVETEKVVLVKSDWDDFYLFDGFSIKQYGTLGYNFNPYAWDTCTGEFKKCEFPKKWNLCSGMTFNDLKFEDVDYNSFIPWFAKLTFPNGKVVRFYDAADFVAKWLPGPCGYEGYKKIVDNGFATIEFANPSEAWRYL
jgi:hypothetical protein